MCDILKITNLLSNKDNKTIFKNMVLDEIAILDKQNTLRRSLMNTKKTYKIKYSNEYYLNCILEVLQYVTSWHVLSKLKVCSSIATNHYKTVHQKFKKWISQNVFINAFNKYICKSNSNLLYIDATPINNKYGSENITLQVENKKKKITKLSVISNSNGFVYSIVPFDINMSLKKNNKIIYSTSVHDTKMINDSILNIKNINPNIENRYFKLFGDKAYKTQDNFSIINKPIIIITPDKRNSKIKNTNYHKKQLKKRNIIEICNKNIKKYDRIMTRKDKKLKYFMGFVFISCLLNNIKTNI